MDGVINVLKPAGMTSHDVVSVFRRILGIRRIGHTGTLDPMAAGVLVLCVGAATKAVEYIEADDKAYRCEMILGTATDTGDIWGNVIGGDREAALAVTEEQAAGALNEAAGVKRQYPPMYSAVKKNGRRLYEYARKGETVEVEPRTVTIGSVRPVSVFHEPARVLFDVECSKGTYIRSVCMDIGERLGCGAAMSCLVRTRSGRLGIGGSVTIEEVIAHAASSEAVSADEILSKKRDKPLTADMSRFLIPVDEMLTGFGSVRLEDKECRSYVNGGRIALRSVRVERKNSMRDGAKYENMYLVYGPENRFYGTALYDKNKRIFTVGKVFFR